MIGGKRTWLAGVDLWAEYVIGTLDSLVEVLRESVSAFSLCGYFFITRIVRRRRNAIGTG